MSEHTPEDEVDLSGDEIPDDLDDDGLDDLLVGVDPDDVTYVEDDD